MIVKTRGEIRNEEAYSQGKMLHHSWQHGIDKLPRNITPMDIDVVFDDKAFGRSLLCELKRGDSPLWRDIETGPRLTYAGLVSRGGGRIFAAILGHNVPLNRKIDSRLDIISVQLMWFTPLLGWATGRVYDGDEWRKIVHAFYAGSALSQWTKSP